MKKETKELLAYLISGIVICVAVIIINWQTQMLFVHRLCDGCFVAAVALLGTAGLRFANKQGTFDMMAFGVRTVFYTAFPAARPTNELRDEDYVGYSERKRAARKSPKQQLIAGLVFLVLSVALLGVYTLVA